jgi:hypothetical protein
VSSSDLRSSAFRSVARHTCGRLFDCRFVHLASDPILTSSGFVRYAPQPWPMVAFIRRRASKYCLKNRTLKGGVLMCQEGDMGCNPLKRTRSRMAFLLVLHAVGLTILSLPTAALDTSFGQRLYQDKADCQFCHGIDGDGRGDPRSPGQAANLHKTILNREQLSR